jgi:hypothetical protein
MEFSAFLDSEWGKFNKIILDIKSACKKPNFFMMEKKTKEFIKTARKLRDFIKKSINEIEYMVPEILKEMHEFLNGIIDAVEIVCNPDFCQYKATAKVRGDICEDFIETVNPLVDELDFLLILSGQKADGKTYLSIERKSNKKSKKRFKRQ